MNSVYCLFHKNIPVLHFRLNDSNFLEIIDILNKEHCPIGVFRDYQKGVSINEQFRSWWKGRSIPSSRQGLKEALESLGKLTTDDLITRAYGLSLSDTYWAKPIKADIKWDEINFYENSFSEDVGKALFGNLDSQNISNISLISPDNTSDGWLQKKWIIDNGKRVLIKGGSGTEQQEPFNEVLARTSLNGSCCSVPLPPLIKTLFPLSIIHFFWSHPSEVLSGEIKLILLIF